MNCIENIEAVELSVSIAMNKSGDRTMHGYANQTRQVQKKISV